MKVLTLFRFFEANEISSFQCLPLLHEAKRVVYIEFKKKFYCHYRGPDLGKRM